MSTQPPGPNGMPIFGNSRQYAKDPFSFLRDVADAYGDIVRFDLGPIDTYMLNNPADIETVLVSDDAKYQKPDFQDDAIGTLLGDGLLLSEGETWHAQRNLAQPAFGPKRIGSLADMMGRHTVEMIDSWEDGGTRDIHLEMARVTVKIIVEAMFGSQLTQQQTNAIQTNLEPLGKRFEPDPLRFLVPDWVPTQENREYNESVEILEGILDDIVAERRGTEDDPRVDPGLKSPTSDDTPMDLLSILLRAQRQGEQSNSQLRDELMTILLAGHDTTALTLTYTWYLLSEHPETRARVQQELDETCNETIPTRTEARKLNYIEQVLQEAMRMYPPVYVIFREPQVDVQLGGYRIPAGSAIMLSQWAVHRSPRWYDEPDRFDPDRWQPERRKDRPRFAYFPFGGGPRHCIGKHLSMLEAKIILGTVAQQYELDYIRNRPFDLRGSLTMHPDEPMGMRVHHRNV
ncbi:MAG: cytochrome P450 [Haloquadratum sp. J07HQX50]|jgi:Cytochrome P450|nr:MAG: cytochrome P450 [Haloquadratum sp. J07HQX50]